MKYRRSVEERSLFFNAYLHIEGEEDGSVDSGHIDVAQQRCSFDPEWSIGDPDMGISSGGKSASKENFANFSHENKYRSNTSSRFDSTVAMTIRLIGPV